MSKGTGFYIDDLLNLSDSAIKAVEDDGYYFSLSKVKDLYQSFLKNKEIAKFYKHFFDMLSHGTFTRYRIKCPKCGVEYKIYTNELNYNKPIQCLDCGELYKQNEHVEGLEYIEDGRLEDE